LSLLSLKAPLSASHNHFFGERTVGESEANHEELLGAAKVGTDLMKLSSIAMPGRLCHATGMEEKKPDSEPTGKFAEVIRKSREQRAKMAKSQAERADLDRVGEQIVGEVTEEKIIN
jgi:hypothetical protein